MQRCHCCARLWRGASTSVVALLLVWASRVRAESTGSSHARRRALLGRLQAEQKLCSRHCQSKQLLSGASAAQKTTAVQRCGYRIYMEAFV